MTSPASKLWYQDETSTSAFPSRDNPAFADWHRQYFELLQNAFLRGNKQMKLQAVKVPVNDSTHTKNAIHRPSRRDTYLEMLQNGEQLPPIYVERDNFSGGFKVEDGCHRYDAAKKFGAKYIDGYEKVRVDEPEPEPVAGAVPVDSTGKLAKSEVGQTAQEPEDHKKLPKRIKVALDAVRAPGVLTDDMRKPMYRGDPHPTRGHCYVATEALAHLIHAPETGWQFCHVRHEGDTHFFLRHQATGTILDPTWDQFQTPPPYRDGRPSGPLTGWARRSKHAETAFSRARNGLKKTEGDEHEHAYRPEVELQPLQKAIAEIPVGQPIHHNPGTGLTVHDYSHVLPIPARSQYKLLLRTEPSTKTITAHIEPLAAKSSRTPQAQVAPADISRSLGCAAMWTGNWRIASAKSKYLNPTQHVGQVILEPWNVLVDDEHRGKGLGLAMYEAAYAHAHHTLGASRVQGGEHSTAADAVHQKLAKKHGLEYESQLKPDAAWASDQFGSNGDDKVGDYDGRFEPYEYMLKSDKVK